MCPFGSFWVSSLSCEFLFASTPVFKYLHQCAFLLPALCLSLNLNLGKGRVLSKVFFSVRMWRASSLITCWLSFICWSFYACWVLPLPVGGYVKCGVRSARPGMWRVINPSRAPGDYWFNMIEVISTKDDGAGITCFVEYPRCGSSHRNRVGACWAVMSYDVIKTQGKALSSMRFACLFLCLFLPCRKWISHVRPRPM